MSLSTVERVLAQAGGGGLAREVHFHVMGEPLLHPDLAAAVRAARRNGMEAWVTTNGSLLGPAPLDELMDAGLSRLTISLQTPDAATFGLRGSASLPFDEYERRVAGTARAFMAGEGGAKLSLCFFVNPLRRFLAPDPPDARVARSGKELRAQLGRWVELIARGTPREGEIPAILARTRRAGVLKENVIPIAPRADFRVRVLGNWAEHFDLPVTPARFGYCPGLADNFGILWNGDYVFCCTDFDGKTSSANVADTSIAGYLASPEVQRAASAFRRFRVAHPHCRACLGERHPLASLFRQFGSILYFKLYRKALAPAGE